MGRRKIGLETMGDEIMGGNVKINEFRAEPLDLTVYPREEYQRDIRQFVWYMNYYIESRLKVVLVDDKNLPYIYSGSAVHLMNPDISTEELLKYKPKFGDIDIFFPKEYKSEVLKFIEDSPYTGNFRHLGTKNGSTISCLYRHSLTEKVHQIDFTPVDFVDGKPSELAVLSHMSDWNDTKNGIKGIFHKKAIGALTAAYGTYGTEEVKEELHYGFLPDYSFCVDRGLRQRYVFMRKAKDGTEIYRKAKPMEFPYISNLYDILDTLLGRSPNKYYCLRNFTRNEYYCLRNFTRNEYYCLRNFTSFLGILELIDKSFTTEQQFRILDKLTGSIYDKLNRPTDDDDEEKRTKVVGFIREKFPWYFSEGRNRELKELADKYYKREK